MGFMDFGEWREFSKDIVGGIFGGFVLIAWQLSYNLLEDAPLSQRVILPTFFAVIFFVLMILFLRWLFLKKERRLRRKDTNEIIFIKTLLFSLVLLFFVYFSSFYVHEYGHVSVAVFSSMAYHLSDVNLSLNYIKQFGLLVPQQTEWIGVNVPLHIKLLYSLAGVLFTTIFYILIFLVLVYILKTSAKRDVWKYLFYGFIVLVIDTLVENLVCGTDGLKLSCSHYLQLTISVVFYLIFAIFIILFFFSYFSLKETK